MFLSSTIGIIFIVVALLITCYYCLRSANYMVYEQHDDINDANADFTNALDFVFQRNGTVNCAHTKLPCVTDRQCQNNCALSAFDYTCDNGFCSLQDPNVSGQPADEVDCDARLGLVKVFVASEFAVRQLCLSTYRDYFDDSGDLRPYICEDGTLNVNLQLHDIFEDNCTCHYGYTRMIFNQTALARSIPVCVPDTLADLFIRIYRE